MHSHRGMASDNSRPSERGVFLPVTALLIIALLGLVALIIDISIQRLVAFQQQYTSDAASLAAVRQLDGTILGWRRAKRAALATFKHSQIMGTGENVSSLAYDASIPESIADTYYEELDSPYAGNRAKSGTLEYVLERGVYFVGLDGTSGYSFRSYEGKELAFGLNTPILTHAIQVRVKNSGLGAFFARILGFETLQGSEPVSIALSDDIEDPCVLPLAVPACEFTLKTDGPPYTHQEINQEVWDYQVQRELTFLDGWWNYADPAFGYPERDGVNGVRRDGIIRADTYARPPYVPNSINPNILVPDSKGFPIRGIIGIPSLEFIEDTLAFDDAHLAMIQSYLQNGAECDDLINGEMRLGARFRAFDNLEDLDNAGGQDVVGDGFFNSSLVFALQGTIAAWINSSSTVYSFLDEFFEGGNPSTPQKHFPYLRGLRGLPPENPADFPDYPAPGAPHKFSDLSIAPPSNFAGQYRTFPSAHLTPSSSNPNDPWYDEWNDSPQLMWTNPLCHDSSIPRTLAGNPGAPRVKVMLIAPPDKENGDPSDYSYCDFNNYLDPSSGSSNIYHPINFTTPVVVGWIYVNIFDLNFIDFAAVGLPNPPTPPGDRNPMTFYIAANDGYRNKWGYFDDCASDPLASPQPGGNNWEDSHTTPSPNRNPHLLQFPNTAPMLCDALDATCPTGGPSVCCPESPSCESTPATCASPTLCARSRQPISYVDDNDKSKGLVQYSESWPGTTKTLGIAQYFPWATVINHPLPAPAPGCPDAVSCPVSGFNYYNAAGWQLNDRSPGRGCSGIRGRVRPELKPFTLSKSTLDERRSVHVPRPGQIQ